MHSWFYTLKFHVSMFKWKNTSLGFCRTLQSKEHLTDMRTWGYDAALHLSTSHQGHAGPYLVCQFLLYFGFTAECWSLSLATLHVCVGAACQVTWTVRTKFALMSCSLTHRVLVSLDARMGPCWMLIETTPSVQCTQVTIRDRQDTRLFKTFRISFTVRELMRIFQKKNQ